MSMTGIPGHCWHMEQDKIEYWHQPGNCDHIDCDRGCCERFGVEDIGLVLMQRQAMLFQVAQAFEDNRDYKTVQFHREVISGVADTEIVTAQFYSNAGTMLGQIVISAI